MPTRSRQHLRATPFPHLTTPGSPGLTSSGPSSGRTPVQPLSGRVRQHSTRLTRLMNSKDCFMNANICELACDILRATKDGEELSPPDLKLLELAVNGFLNETGE